jgi:hypothetical protein
MPTNSWDFGHAHSHDHRLWFRGLSRRGFIGAAFASGAALALPAIAKAERTDKTLPNPILGGTLLPGKPLPRPFYFPTRNTPMGPNTALEHNVEDGTGDASTIRDFNGIVGLAEFPPTGVVSGDPMGGAVWAGDVRFMHGEFIDRDGHRHQGTVSFI